MIANHHLDDATIISYAAGDLDEAFSVVVASHLAMCSDCRRAVRSAEELGGALLDSEVEVTLADNAFDAVLRRLESDNASAPIDLTAHRVSSRKSDKSSRNRECAVPLPLRRYIGVSLDEVKWKTIAPGIKRHMISLDDSSSNLYLLNIAPGLALPEHGHGGSEMTLVLSGAYRDGLGRFQAGDIADLDEHVEHQPKVEEGERCICLIATEAPTKFKGWVNKILQPFVGI